MSNASLAFPLTFERLERLAVTGRGIALWWRDDDARKPSAALDRLLSLRDTAGVPLALAVIPEGTGLALAERLAREPDVSVLQHGLTHENHAPAGEKRAEFGDHRKTDAMLAELATGRRHLEKLFADRFLPVFVPPWNRIGQTLAARLPEAGLAGLSVFANAAPGGTQPVNTHLDLMDWHPGPGLAPQGLNVAAVDRLLADLIDWQLTLNAVAFDRMPTLMPEQGSKVEAVGTTGCKRASPPTAPIGLLTHHLQHDERAWETLEVVLAWLAVHPAIVWPTPAALFSAT